MRSSLNLPRDQVEALRPGDVQLYLRSHGWVPVRDEGTPAALEYRNPSFPNTELLVPVKREVGDFVLRMAEVVVGLAALEKRAAAETLRDLSSPPGDVIRLRVVAADAALGNLRLEDGIQLLRGGRDLLLAAAHSTLEPRSLHPQIMPRQVKQFLSDCRLGQTERGSFVATIITPVPPDLQKVMEFDDPVVRARLEPYSRRVTIALMKTLGFVSTSIKNGEPNRILEGVEEGVSANLCEALREMRPPGDQSSLDISVTWARGRASAAAPQAVSFPRESFSIIEEAGRALRVRAVARPTRYQGKLIGTELINRPFTRGPVGRIVMSTQVAGERAKLKVDLSPEDFALACGALPRAPIVAVTGVIRGEVKTRVYELSDPRDFKVM